MPRPTLSTLSTLAIAAMDASYALRRWDEHADRCRACDEARERPALCEAGGRLWTTYWTLRERVDMLRAEARWDA